MAQARKPATAPNWWRAQAAGDSAVVEIYGDIGESLWGEETVAAKDLVRELRGPLAGMKSLDVRINSYGGAVADGIAIHNALREHGAEVTVTIDGVAVSIASLIAMAGDKVRMPSNALLMIHAPWGMGVGNANDMRSLADALDAHAQAMVTSYERKTGKPRDELLPLVTDGEDHWYTAEAAIAAGFADELVTDADATAAAARYIAPVVARFPTLPAAIAAAYMPAKETIPMATQQKPPVGEKPAVPAAAQTTTTEQTPASETQATPDNVAQIEAAAEARLMARVRERNEALASTIGPFLAREGIREVYDAILADPSVTLAQARERILAKLGEGAEPLTPPGYGAHITSGQDSVEKVRGAMQESLLARMGAAEHDGANPFRGHRLTDIARACLERAGMRVAGALPEEIANLVIRAQQTTSDFPVVLENTMHKLVLMGFQAQPTTWQRVAKTGVVSDFRAWNRLVPGLIGNLDDVTESGEYKNKTIPDATKNAVQATRKGNIINITPEVLVNDDMGYIQSMADGLGRAGGRAIDRRFYTLLESNPTLTSDSTALFHADHGNLAASGAAPTMLLIDAARAAMAIQTAPGDDAEYLDIRPAVALCNTALGGQLRGIFGAQYDPDTANKLQKPNIVKDIVRDIVDTPRVSAAPWYLFADPNVAPVIEVVFLNGQREPRLVQEESFRTGGLSWRVELPFGVGAIDYRGAYKNPGT